MREILFELDDDRHKEMIVIREGKKWDQLIRYYHNKGSTIVSKTIYLRSIYLNNLYRVRKPLKVIKKEKWEAI